MIEIGDKIRIQNMVGEPHYTGRVGVVTAIDSIGQIHTTAGGLALQSNDQFVIIQKAEEHNDTDRW